MKVVHFQRKYLTSLVIGLQFRQDRKQNRRVPASRRCHCDWRLNFCLFFEGRVNFIVLFTVLLPLCGCVSVRVLSSIVGGCVCHLHVIVRAINKSNDGREILKAITNLGISHLARPVIPASRTISGCALGGRRTSWSPSSWWTQGHLCAARSPLVHQGCLLAVPDNAS